MQDKIKVFSPAKVNLFLNVLNRRKDGYHNIISGITFINLFDEIEIKKSDLFSINYSGEFRPKNGKYNDCVIKKTLKLLNIYKTKNLEINITKNIPVRGGLGSASTNVAGLIKVLTKLKLIERKNRSFFTSIGSDVPVCLYGQSSIIRGIGNLISSQKFPKYYFLIVKPSLNFSTKAMYKKIDKNLIKKNNITTSNLKTTLIKYKRCNDFEKIAVLEKTEIKILLDFLSKRERVLFSGMTGSGSCCFATFKNFKFAKEAKKKLKENFPNYWSFAGHNLT